MRLLDECAQGIDLIAEWIREAEKTDVHFINHIVLPARNLPLHVFKSVRWMGKSTVSLIKQLWPQAIALMRLSSDEVAQAFHRLQVFPSIEAARAALENHTIDVSEISAALKLKLDGKSIKAKLFGEKLVEAVAAYAENDKSGTTISALTSKEQIIRSGFVLLDCVNLGLAIIALTETKSTQDHLQAALSVGAASGFLAASMVDALLKLNFVQTSTVISPAARKVALRFANLARGVCGIIYAALDFADAIEADAKGDHDRKIALLIAGTAELCASYIAFGSMIAGVPVLGTPLAIAGVVAALAYTAAMYLTDDPLEKFLLNCEYAKTPYAELDYAPIWATYPVSKWKGNHRLQQTLLLRLLTRFSLSWDRTDKAQKFLVGVQIGCAMRTPDMRIEVRFVETFANGDKSKKHHVFEHESLPLDSAQSIVIISPNYLGDTRGIRDVVAHATLKIHRERFEESHSAYIVRDGESIRRGERSRFT